VAGEQAGALSRGTDGRESSRVRLQGQRAQLLSASTGKGGEGHEPKEPAAP